jgi:hypothetical protein
MITTETSEKRNRLAIWAARRNSSMHSDRPKSNQHEELVYLLRELVKVLTSTGYLGALAGGLDDIAGAISTLFERNWELPSKKYEELPGVFEPLRAAIARGVSEGIDSAFSELAENVDDEEHPVKVLSKAVAMAFAEQFRGAFCSRPESQPISGGEAAPLIPELGSPVADHS